MMAIFQSAAGDSSTLSAGSSSGDFLSGLDVRTTRAVRQRSPVAAYPAVLTACGQSLQVAFDVVRKGGSGGFTQLIQGKGALKIIAPDRSASLVYTPAVLASVQIMPLAGDFNRVSYNIQAAQTFNIASDDDGVIWTDAEGVALADDDGLLIESE